MVVLRASLACALIVCALTHSWAMDGQPTQQLVRIGDDGTLLLQAQHQKPVYETQTYEFTVMVPYEETVNVEVNGETRQESRTRTRPETRTAQRVVCKFVPVVEEQALDLGSAKAFEVDGRPIATASLTERLQNGMLVVVSATEDMIPDYYATVFQPGTIVLAFPKPQHGYGTPQPVPVAPPVSAPPPPPNGEAPSVQTPGRAAVIQPVSRQVRLVPGDNPAEPQQLDSAPVELPATPQPQIVFVSRTGANDLKIRQFVETPVESEVTIRSTDSSISPELTIKVQRLSRRNENTIVPMNLLRFSTREARDIAADRIKERLGTAGETTVLISADGQPVDAFWLQNIKPSVLVLRGVKLSPVQAGYGTMPAPSAYWPGTPVAPAAPPPTPVPSLEAPPIPAPAQAAPQ